MLKRVVMQGPALDAILSDRLTNPDLKSYTSWQHPLLPLHVYMHPEAVGSISSHALQALQQDEPAEVGGLLWGRTHHSKKSTEVVIVYAQFIAGKGGLYNQNGSDTLGLVAAMRSPAGPLSCVGFFRSHVREGLALSPEDQKFIESYMTDPSSVFLVARPFDMGICMAGLFFWDGGRLQTETSDLEVPLIAGSKASAEEQLESEPQLEIDNSKPISAASAPVHATDPLPAEVEPVPVTPQPDSDKIEPTIYKFGNLEPEPRKVETKRAAAEEVTYSFEPVAQKPPASSPVAPKPPASSPDPIPAKEPEKQEPRSYVRPAPRRSPIALWLLLGFILASFTGVAVYFGLPAIRARLGSGDAGANRQIGLQVVRAPDGQLDLAWNKSALPLDAAKEAKLTIIDGSQVRELMIDAAQLRSGKLGYFPSGNDVQFKFEIHLDPLHAMSESIRVLLPPAAPGAPLPQPVSVEPIENPLKADPAGRTRVKSKPAPEKPAPRKVDVTHFDARASGPFKREGTGDTAVLPPPPSVSYSVGAVDRAVLNQLPGSVPLPPAYPAAPPKQAQPSETAPRQSVPNTGRTGPANYVPPRVLRQSFPDLKLLRLMLPAAPETAATVEVQVTVDTNGQVIDARPAASARGGNAMLTSAAVSAAKKWVFAPATVSGKPVTAGHTIVFEFRPAANNR